MPLSIDFGSEEFVSMDVGFREHNWITEIQMDVHCGPMITPQVWKVFSSQIM